MKRLCSVLLLCVFSGRMLLAGTAPDTIKDTEQTYLEVEYVYQNVLGIRFDTMYNIALYQEILAWIGTPYCYSGETKNGVDCSGFVNRISENVYHMPLAASSADIYKDNITPLKKSDLREGDLVFFKIRKKKVSHVGIYLGSNLFAHSSVKQGVIISSLEEDYYTKYFFKGGRIKK